MTTTTRSAQATKISVDQRVAAYVRDRHGIIDTRGAALCGLTDAAIRTRLRRGSWHRVHWGVYVVGHAKLTRPARMMAATLAVGLDECAVTGWTALEHRGIDRFARRGNIELVARSRVRKELGGVDVRTTAQLHPADIKRIANIPVVSVARALIDLADCATPFVLANVMYEAEYLHLLDVERLRALARGLCNRESSRTLQAAIALRDSGSPGVKSKLEEQCVLALIEADVSCPEVNVLVHPSGSSEPVRPDLLWRTERVVLEVDGVGHKRRRAQMMDDVNRMRLEAAGFLVLRASQDQVRYGMPGVIAAVNAALAARAGRVFLDDLD
ncbi:MAG: type IV toxin-antitoxin system AbiEi family antitoxin domain-containing protein [Gaiellales bacterium]